MNILAYHRTIVGGRAKLKSSLKKLWYSDLFVKLWVLVAVDEERDNGSIDKSDKEYKLALFSNEATHKILFL